MMYFVLVLCILTLINQSTGQLNGNQENSESMATTKAGTTTDSNTLSMEENNALNSTENATKQNDSGSRHVHSRMLPLQKLFTNATTTTTIRPTAYDYWWFFTTSRRPFLSYRDYPGKPGVATWKEISPVAAKEKNKGDPTAAGVSSNAVTRLAIPYFCATLILIVAEQSIAYI